MAEVKLDLRPNSDKSKATQNSDVSTQMSVPDKKNLPKPTLSKGAVKKKPDILSKVADTFLQGRNLSDVGHYVLVDVLIPKLIDGLASAGKAAIDGVFYGEGAKSKPASSYGNNRTNYSSRISGGGIVARGGTGNSMNVQSYHKVRRGFENVTIESRMDAEAMLNYLQNTIAKYDSVSIADFYDAFQDANITSQYTDNNWGWFNLDGVPIKHVPGGWQIEFPEPEKLG